MKKLTSLSLFGVFFCLSSFGQQFKVIYTAAAFKQSFSGKVLLYLSKENRSPKDAMVDLDVFPCFMIPVKDVRPGDTVVFDDKATAYPVALSDVERGDYYVQAVWDRNLGGRSIGE